MFGGTASQLCAVDLPNVLNQNREHVVDVVVVAAVIFIAIATLAVVVVAVVVVMVAIC